MVVFIHLLDRVFPEASVALFVAELMRTDVSVCFCLEPSWNECAGPLGTVVAACLGKEWGEFTSCLSLISPFAALRFTRCKMLWLHGLRWWVISRSVDQYLLIQTHLMCCQWCLGISEHQPALKEAKEMSFSVWNSYFHGRAAQVWFESEL